MFCKFFLGTTKLKKFLKSLYPKATSFLAKSLPMKARGYHLSHSELTGGLTFLAGLTQPCSPWTSLRSTEHTPIPELKKPTFNCGTESILKASKYQCQLM